MADMVNHPSHYANGKIECIDVMLQQFSVRDVMAFCKLNAFKYIYRMDLKHLSGLEDAQKAKWYIDKYIELSQKGDED